MNDQSLKHLAFISYRREQPDQSIAEYLKKRLKRFVLPSSIRRKMSLPRRLRDLGEVFLDQEDALVGGELVDRIIGALGQSKFLIVLISPRTREQESVWVPKEIKHFIALERRLRIIPVVVDGNLTEAQHMFGSDDESLTLVDVRAKSPHKIRKRLDAELHRIVATMVGCDPYQLRNELIIRQRRIAVGAFAGTLAIGATLATLWFRADMEWREAQVRRAEALASAAQKELAADHPRAAVRLATEAVAIGSASLKPRLALWEMAGHLAADKPLGVGIPSLQSGIDTLVDGRIVTTSAARIVVVNEAEPQTDWPYPIGAYLSMKVLAGPGIVLIQKIDGRLVGFDAKTHRMVLDVAHPEGCIWMDVARDADLIAVGCRDGVVFLDQVSEGGAVKNRQLTFPFSGKDSAIVALSRDGRKLFAAAGGQLQSRDLESPERVQWDRNIDKNIQWMVVSPNGRWLAWASPDGMVRMARADDGTEIHQWSTRALVKGLAFSPDSNHLAMIGWWPQDEDHDAGIREWDVESGAATLVFEAPTKLVSLAYLGPDRLVAGAQDGGGLHRVDRPVLRRTVGRGPWVQSLERDSTTGKLVAIRCGDPLGRVNYNRQLMLVVGELGAGVEASCQALGNGDWHVLGESPSVVPLMTTGALAGDSMLVGTKKGEVLRLPLHRESPVGAMPPPIFVSPKGHAIRLLRFAPPHWVALYDEPGGVGGLYRLDGNRLEPVWLARKEAESGQIRMLGDMTAARLAPDKGYAVLAFGLWMAQKNDSAIVVVDLAKRSVIANISVPGGLVRDLIPIRHGTMWAAATADGRIHIFDATTWKTVTTLLASDMSLYALALWHPHGEVAHEILIVSDGAGRLGFWDTEDFSILYATRPQGEMITALLPDHGGLWIGAGTNVQWWDGLDDPNRLDAVVREANLDTVASLRERITRRKNTDDANGALAVSESMIRLRPDNPNVLSEHIDYLRDAGNFDQALADIDRLGMLQTRLIDEMQVTQPKQNQTSTANYLYYNRLVRKASIQWQKWKKTGESSARTDAALTALNAVNTLPQDLLGHLLVQRFLMATGHFDVVAKTGPLVYRLHGEQKEKRIARREFALLTRLAELIEGRDTAAVRTLVGESWTEEPADRKDTGHKNLHDLLSGVETSGSVRDSSIGGISDTTLHVQLRLAYGLRLQAAGDKNAARTQFEKGMAGGDYLGLSRQALMRMSGTWVPNPLAQEALSGYREHLARLTPEH